MNRLNRDTVIAVILMLFCGVFFWASFDIREPDYGVLPPSAWPRVILGLLALLSVIYLVQSLRHGVPDRQENATDASNFRQVGGGDSVTGMRTGVIPSGVLSSFSVMSPRYRFSVC